ncbi:hypothetical protein KFO32_09135 [Pantoea ananatis]|uniref:hypothetical protein n=1 Tax=Pantoea ananas TaxID=553 RepID=UPI001FF30C2C|nr:hypothetical protein [Pantoea ananatis]MCK0553221.1 hypothetical protein [Pantoea ananatis]
MSEDNQLLFTLLRNMKSDTDILLDQLTKGDYLTPDTFANNWALLVRLVEAVNDNLVKPGVAEKLVQADPFLMADLMSLSRAVAIVENFMACETRRAHTDERSGKR